jgi:hypothetical protein
MLQNLVFAILAEEKIYGVGDAEGLTGLVVAAG